MTDSERTITRHLAPDGRHISIVEKWLDTQVSPPRRRSKNWRVRLKPGEVAYYQLMVEAGRTEASGVRLASSRATENTSSLEEVG